MRKLWLLCCVSLVSACDLAPDLQLPEFIAPKRFPNSPPYDAALLQEGDLKDTPPPLSQFAWQTYYRDPTLQTLIRQGLSANRNLAQAALSIEEARALYDIEEGALFPDITADGSYRREDYPGAGSFGGTTTGGTGFSQGGGPSDTYQAALGVTAYELDLFGRLRNLSASAWNQYLATKAAYDTIRLTLISDIAQAYITLKSNQVLLRLADSTVQAQSDALDLIQLRVDNGIANELEARQAQILYEQARVDRVILQRSIAQNINQLRLLLGTPEAMPPFDTIYDMNAFDILVPRIPIGLPSTLLLSRPDIQQAEHQFNAANASVGAARAAFFPRISLTAAIGFISPELDGLFDDDTRYWSYGPNISQPIFTGGELSGSLDVAKVRKNQAVVNYEQQIERAFREVSDALAAVSTYDEQIQTQRSLVEATLRATNLSELRYEEGVDNYLAVLDARRELYNAQQNLIRQQAEDIAARITLYRAVGGGREATDTPKEAMEPIADTKDIPETENAQKP